LRFFNKPQKELYFWHECIGVSTLFSLIRAARQSRFWHFSLYD